MVSKSLIPAVPISIAFTALWIDWWQGVMLIIIMFSMGCFACHVWLCGKTIRTRLCEIPEEKRTPIQLLLISNDVRTRLPSLLAQRALASFPSPFPIAH